MNKSVSEGNTGAQGKPGKGEVITAGGPFLYLVLHGEFAIIDIAGATGITVLAPAMDEHAYLAGPWLGERHVPQGTTLGLSANVKPGDDTFASKGFITFSGVSPDRNSAWMELRLPRPLAVLACETRVLAKGSITINGPTGVTLQPLPSSVAIVPVLQYALADSTPPFLFDVNAMEAPRKWEAGGSAGKKVEKCFSLHVLAEVDLDPNDNGVHVAMAFQMAAKLMGVDASITPGATSDKGSTSARLPPLALPETSLLLYRRISLFGGLGAQQCSGCDKPVMDLDPPYALTEASCGPVVGS